MYDAHTLAVVRRLTPDIAHYEHRFGYSVNIDDGVAVVGAIGTNAEFACAGAASVFDVRTGVQIVRLTASDSVADAALGTAVDIQDGNVVVGSQSTPPNSGGSGGAFFDEPGCTGHVNFDGSLDILDVYEWIAAFEIALYTFHQNGDGLCTPADLSAWIANFNNGCGTVSP